MIFTHHDLQLERKTGKSVLRTKLLSYRKKWHFCTLKCNEKWPRPGTSTRKPGSPLWVNLVSLTYESFHSKTETFSIALRFLKDLVMDVSATEKNRYLVFGLKTQQNNGSRRLTATAADPFAIGFLLFYLILCGNGK